MKGILFTELVEMIEERYSPEMADRVLCNADLASGGAYTSVGRYPSQEWMAIVRSLSSETGVPGNVLVRAFGEHLFGRFKQLYPDMLRSGDAFSLFESVDGFIHVEMRKLHPDAELPTFRCSRPDASSLIMDYYSPRPLADLAEGLIQGALRHFAENVEVHRHDFPGGPPYQARFSMRR
jgi:hypothetical protein